MAAGKQFGRLNTTSLNHEGHEVTRRVQLLGFLRVPSCPLWFAPSPVCLLIPTRVY